MWEAAITILKQLFRKPATNIFPAKYAPESTLSFLEKVARQEVKLHPPVAIPPKFRGKIAYDKEGCTGCRLCISICPTRTIEFIPEEKSENICLQMLFLRSVCRCLSGEYAGYDGRVSACQL